MNGPTEKTFAEFFAGIGLMRIGLENAGWRIAFANDIERDKWQMYKDHFGDTGEFILEDVHNLKASAGSDGRSGYCFVSLQRFVLGWRPSWLGWRTVVCLLGFYKDACFGQ